MLPGSAPYAEMVEALPAYWDRVRDQARLPLIVSTQAGWDSTPRSLGNQSPGSRWMRTDNTPDLLEQTLRDARERVDPELPLLLIEAWNEWGEGSFIEPGKRYGFGQLEAVRRVFAPGAPPHRWHAPSPALVDSYSVLRGEELAAARAREKQPDPPPPHRVQVVRHDVDPAHLPRTLIQESDAVPMPEQVAISQGLRFVGTHEAGARFEIVGGDPFIVIETRNGDRPLSDLEVAIRVRYDGPGTGFTELFYATDDNGFSASRSYRYNWKNDGTSHTYRFRFEDGEETQGRLTQVRLDPPDEPGSTVTVEWVRVLRAE
jgi:hypothetical protein